MNIVMVGTGYVGLVSGVCFSEFGHRVACVDQNEAKIAALQHGEVPIFEPGLQALMERNVERLTFTTDLARFVRDADVVFLAVGTPSRRGDGEADLSYVHAAARQIAPELKAGAVVVIKSTVVVGTASLVRATIQETNAKADFSIASNPEFLREGSAINDFLHPDRVVIGAEDERARSCLSRLYRPLNLRESPIIFTSLADAELTKYAANAFLAMKITFINEIANLCEKVGGNVQEVAQAIGLDNRIGAKFLHPGPGFGGSCFPKDTRALAAIGQNHGAPLRLVETTVSVNEERIQSLKDRVKIAAGGNLANLTIGVLGVAFKPNTDDVREAASLALIPGLQSEGATIKAHDPQAAKAAGEILSNTEWCHTPYEAARGADILVILTEWNEYRALDLTELGRVMAGNLIVDLRNIYKREEMMGRGFRYLSIGRQPVEPFP
jgi:UDPglucose 6-dehydrogenase